MLKHNSHDPFYRVPAGPVPLGSKVLIRFSCDEASAVTLRTWFGIETTYAMQTDDGLTWEACAQLPRKPGLFWYDFIIHCCDGRTLRYGNQADLLGGEGRLYGDGELHSYQITVFSPDYRTPAYMHGANIYQIFPDRFFRAPTEAVDDRTDRYIHRDWAEPLLTGTDDRCDDYMGCEFYGGTLNGIREKLPYLQEMGIDVIYLNPIFRSYSFHHYDTGDYTQIDPLLGTEAEFTALCDEARDMGIRIMLDGVFSHTGDDSRYFNRYGTYDSIGAWQGKESPYYGWYTFRKFPDEYACWWDFISLPECRKNDPSYQRFMFNEQNGIVRQWIRAGACGWRLDVADELSMDFLRKLRTAAKATDPDAVVLGEVWEDASNKLAYGEVRCYCTGDTLDSVMNYPLREAIIDFVMGRMTAFEFKRLVDHQAEVYPPQFRYALMNLLGSHDRARVLNVLCSKDGTKLSREAQRTVRLTPPEYALAARRYRTCVRLLCALPGCPTIYYGDEAGATGCTDPYCRQPFPWGREDKRLQRDVMAMMHTRSHSDVMRTGHCEVIAVDDDTLRIRRYYNGTDALGNLCGYDEKSIEICRK